MQDSNSLRLSPTEDDEDWVKADKVLLNRSTMTFAANECSIAYG